MRSERPNRFTLWLVTFSAAGSGLLNIYSVVCNSLPARAHLLKEIFPLEFWYFSRTLTLLIGFVLIIFSINIYRRKRRAFWLVVILSLLSVTFHLANDYAEASVALLLLLLLQGMSFWLVMRAYGLGLPFPAGVAVILIVHLGTAVPNAPANIGTYQFFTVTGLTLFGVDKSSAAGFSLAVFAILTLPLWALGSWALGRSGLTLLDVRTDLVGSQPGGGQ